MDGTRVTHGRHPCNPWTAPVDPMVGAPVDHMVGAPVDPMVGAPVDPMVGTPYTQGWHAVYTGLARRIHILDFSTGQGGPGTRVDAYTGLGTVGVGTGIKRLYGYTAVHAAHGWPACSCRVPTTE